MKRNIYVFGSISGVILALYIASFNFVHLESLVLGYTAMVIAFAFIYVGIRNFRDKFNAGIVSFGKAFRLGLGITLVGSTIYVLAWLIQYYVFMPHWMDKFVAQMVQQAKTSGLTGAALDKKIADINKMGDSYKNPLFVVMMTYVEVLPVGIVISLLAALILKKKPI